MYRTGQCSNAKGGGTGRATGHVQQREQTDARLACRRAYRQPSLGEREQANATKSGDIRGEMAWRSVAPVHRYCLMATMIGQLAGRLGEGISGCDGVREATCGI